MLDTLEVVKNLLEITVVLACSSSHEPSECRKSIHDLGYRVDRDVDQFTDQFVISGDDILVRDIGPWKRSKISANNH
jgi:hypothetical protein